MKTLIMLGVVVLALACATATAQELRCGNQGSGMLCPNNLCCSKSGYCGLGSEYCGAGCQNGPCRADIPCSGDRRCPNNLCCSKQGYCGLGAEFCGEGCQSGACSSDRRCGRQGGNAACPGNLCCSSDGYCGLGGSYCSNGCQSGPCSTKAPSSTGRSQLHGGELRPDCCHPAVRTVEGRAQHESPPFPLQ